MTIRIPLDPKLAERAFTTTEASKHGLGRGRLMSPDLQRPFHGVRTAATLPLPLQYAPLLRLGDRFSHTTAGELWGVPLPRNVDGHLHVTAHLSHQRPRSNGIVGHTSVRGGEMTRNSLPVSDPLTMFLELAQILSHDDLVAVGDHLVLDPRVLDPQDIRPYLTLSELRSGCISASGRAVRMARRAALDVRAGVESPMETRLRLLLMRAGLPEPVCGYELHDSGGRHIGWFDLAWPELRVIAEYDGDMHRTSTAQYDKDITRFDRADGIGWKVIRVRSRGVYRDAATTVRRVSTALDAASRRKDTFD